ncbi:MAG: hypothetical protein PHI24_10325, partial [Desulfitobacteriaceae bacterium]|nr:hypothetical protein [Desulfitobacteriaceae bacterium]
VQTAVIYEDGVKVGTITIDCRSGNDLGIITIHSDPERTIEVNFEGTFNRPVRVEGEGTSIINYPSDGAGGGGGGGGGGGDSATLPLISSITSGASGPNIANINNTQKTIEIIPSADIYKRPTIKVSQNSAMKLKVIREAKTYDLGTWSLTKSDNGNEILSDLRNLDFFETLKFLQVSGLTTSSEIFSVIDFQALLTAAKSLDPSDKDIVYDNITSILELVQGNPPTTDFYQALRLPQLYSVTDLATRNSIKAIITAAIPAASGVTADQLLGSDTSASAIATLTNSGQMSTFLENIDFTNLFSALRKSPQKQAIYEAIDFTSMWKGIPSSKMLSVGVHLSKILDTVNTGDAINFGRLLQLLMSDPNEVYLELTNSAGTTQYRCYNTPEV